MTSNPSAASINSQYMLPVINQEEFEKLLKCHQDEWPDLSTTTVPRIGRMHMVSRQVRLMEEKREVVTSVYDPIMVSLGPYHHGKKDGMFSRAEEFKRNTCLVSFAGHDPEQKICLYNKIRGDIDNIKGCYDIASIPKPYNEDDKLALMMLLDSCFILNFMENCMRERTWGRGAWNDWQKCLGVAEAVQFTTRDIMVLENQIPFFVVEYAIKAKYTNEEGRVVKEGEELVQQFISWMLDVDFKDAIIPNRESSPPLHILEACRRVITYEHRPNATRSDKEAKYLTCPSVTDLKAKGISFHPCRSSNCLKDIKFKPYYWLFGQLQLPVRSVSELTQVILSNMIAYEISPATTTDLTVLSYTNFMKSLIETPADVKELQDKEIFQINRLSDLEQVVQLFKRIDTFGLQNVEIYEDVMQKVGEHCQTKRKTWMAELLHGKLKSPWTIIGLLAATLLVVLTFLQTWYAMHPVRDTAQAPPPNYR